MKIIKTTFTNDVKTAALEVIALNYRVIVKLDNLSDFNNLKEISLTKETAIEFAEELKNVIERLVIMVSAPVIRAEHIPSNILGKRRSNGLSVAPGEPWKPLKEARNAFEKQYILQCLKMQQGNITKTAQILGIERTYLHKKIRMYQEPSEQ